MKIAVDFREGAKSNRAGKGEYIFRLVLAWIDSSPHDEVTLVIEHGQKLDFALPANWRVKTFPASAIFWQAMVWLWLEFTRPVDVYFSTTSLILPSVLRSVKVVTTLADFTVWRFPDKHPSRLVILERIFMPLALKFSNHLLAISEFTASEARVLFSVPSHKLTVTPLAVSPQFSSQPLAFDDIAKARQKYNLPDKFLLYLGTLEPRKNIARIIEAFQVISPEFPDTHLVLAGAKGWLIDDLFHQPIPHVLLTGYVDNLDRAILYKLALGFVFPSFYEGFGLPPLEAMSCGTPVITARTASLPEVVGDSALLVDPNSTEELVVAMRQLLSSPELRMDLSRRGLQQSQQFNWQRTLEQTLTVLHRYA